MFNIHVFITNVLKWFKMNYWLNKLNNVLLSPKLNNFLLFNLLTNYSKFSFWQFFFFGFYFDEIFSRILKFLYFKFLSLTSYFVVDRFFSNWSGIKLFQSLFSLFNNFFFFLNLNFFFFFIVIINTFFFFLLFHIFIFYIFI